MTETADDLAKGVFQEVRTIVGSGSPLGSGTEIYKELRVSGDDLWELLLAIHKRYGTKFDRMDLRKFAPGEAEWDWPLPFPQRRYLSLTIRDLVTAVRRGEWIESE